jgi:hypothetical protein
MTTRREQLNPRNSLRVPGPSMNALLRNERFEAFFAVRTRFVESFFGGGGEEDFGGGRDGEIAAAEVVVGFFA